MSQQIEIFKHINNFLDPQTCRLLKSVVLNFKNKIKIIHEFKIRIMRILYKRIILKFQYVKNC